MSMSRLLLAAAASLALAGCEPARPLAPVSAALSETQGNPTPDVPHTSARGGGHYTIAGLEVQFEFAAEGHGGAAAGTFHHRTVEPNGAVIAFVGTVSCLTVDPVNHRAWIGGTITSNGSTDPAFMNAINAPGQDIWFRVLDSDQGPEVADRTSFVGFKGSGGILTSAEYCATAPWLADNARTNALTKGQLWVRP